MPEKVIFINSVSQSIIADKVSQDDKFLVVERPALLNLEVLQNGQIRLKMFPLLFPEFLEDPNPTFPFNLSEITLPTAKPSAAVANQHDQVFSLHVPAPAQAEGAPAIGLFEEV